MNGDDDSDELEITGFNPPRQKLKQKSMTWVSSSFDDFSPCPLPAQQSLTRSRPTDLQSNREACSFSHKNEVRKRKREQLHQLKTQIREETLQHVKANGAAKRELWSEIYKPLKRTDLAVHAKKIDEIVEWLRVEASNFKKHSAPILLMTGPPGVGKTVSVKVLCAELGLDIQEWSSSSEHGADQWSNDSFRNSERSKVDVYSSQSQSSLFHNFLMRANKYRPLDLTGPLDNRLLSDKRNRGNKENCIILVEDLPNIFYRDSSQLHEILRKYHFFGKCPIVFVLTEVNSNSSGVNKMFPRDILHELKITNISVNPVAPTMLMKTLKRVVSQEAEQRRFSTPSASVIETIAMSSSGDIRSALNALQFACSTDTADLQNLCATSSKIQMRKALSGSKLKHRSSEQSLDKNGESEKALVMGKKDTAVFLFHAVGKVLYFKRGEGKKDDSSSHLPSHLKQYERDPLLLNPEEVVFKAQIPGDYFNSYLHENYVDFLSSVDDLERAAEYFSDSDCFSHLWAAREELQNYSISIATRGFIHSNSDCTRHDSIRSNRGWRPLHKSGTFYTNKQASENLMTARCLFKGYHWEPEVLCTEILPYISLTNPTLHDAGQIRFIQEMTQFSSHKHVTRFNRERLDAKDVPEDNGEDIDLEKERYLSHGLTSTSLDTESIIGTSSGNKDIRATEDFDSDDDTLLSSQTQVQGMGDEDEIVIEEYDD